VFGRLFRNEGARQHVTTQGRPATLEGEGHCGGIQQKKKRCGFGGGGGNRGFDFGVGKEEMGKGRADKLTQGGDKALKVFLLG